MFSRHFHTCSWIVCDNPNPVLMSLPWHWDRGAKGPHNLLALWWQSRDKASSGHSPPPCAKDLPEFFGVPLSWCGKTLQDWERHAKGREAICTWLPHRPFLPRCKICKEKKTGILNSELCSKRIHFSVRKGVFLPGLCNCTAYLRFPGPLSSLQCLPQENREHTIGLIIL